MKEHKLLMKERGKSSEKMSDNQVKEERDRDGQGKCDHQLD
jgi:hypothetical protein